MHDDSAKRRKRRDRVGEQPHDNHQKKDGIEAKGEQ
jgi:hypothetical protein